MEDNACDVTGLFVPFCDSFGRRDVHVVQAAVTESEAESGIPPVLALNQMTDSHLMEASLSKQTQYTLALLGPPPHKEQIAASSLQGYHSGSPSIEYIVQ